MSGATPPSKRAKLESLAPSPVLNDTDVQDPEFQCSICLQEIVDRTVLPTCFHEFCFECLVVWSEQSRRCPLCSQAMGDYLLHNIRSKYDFRKHHLAPLRKSPPPQQHVDQARRRRRTAREMERERRLREEREAADRLTQSIERRRWIYHHHLYAKHVASNAYTRYRPYPTPSQFAASNDLISKTTMFLRRELQVWDDLDVEFLTTFIISMMKAIDIRSQSAVKLLAEFLDMDAPYVEGGHNLNAEHFAHEVYSFVRSPFRDLFVYDSAVQYDSVNVSPLPDEQGRRWCSITHLASRSRSRHRSRSRSQSHSRSSRDRSISWSPSGRHYPSSRTSRGRITNDDRGNFEDDMRCPTHSSPSSRGTSRRPIEASVKGKERAEPVVEIDLPAAEEPFVAQPNTDGDAAAPAAVRRPTVRPPRSGYGSLHQSIQNHLRLEGANNRNVSGSKGRGSERHHDAPHLVHESVPSSPPAPPGPASDLPDVEGHEYGSESGFLASSSQSTAIRHHDTSPDNKSPILYVYTSRGSKGSSAEITPQQIQTQTAQAALEPRVPETTNSSSPSAPPSDYDSHTQRRSTTPSQKDNMAKNALDLEALHVHGTNPTTSPPTAPSGGSCTTTVTSPPQTHPFPISSSSENTFHQEAASGIHHMGISQHNIPIDDLRPLMSAHANNEESHQAVRSTARKKLLARLERERLHGHNLGTSTGPETTSQSANVGELKCPSSQSEQVSSAVTADPHVVEAKLRRRAQLRVRLAAEKRRTRI